MTTRPSWYSIRRHAAVASAGLAAAQAAGAPVPRSSAEILIYGEIGESWWSESVSASQFVRDLAALDVDAISVRINSIGGSVPDGIAIHNAMKRHQATITTVIDGMALSIASLIAAGGDHVQAAENATVMVHAPWTIAAGNSVELREVADQLDTWARAMSTSYAAKTGQTQDEALALLSDGKDHWYTAAEAKAAGLVDEVISAAPVAAMASFDLTRFRDVPEHLRAALASHRKPAARQGAQADLFAPIDPPAAPAAPTAASPAANALENTPMPGNSTTTTTTPDAAAIEAARAEGARAETQRCADIRAAFKPFAARDGMQAELEACLADPTVSAAAANQRILAQMAKGAGPAAGGHVPVQTLEDERDKRIEAGVQALMARAAVLGRDGKRVQMDSRNPFRGQTLLEIAKASLARAGFKTDGMDKMQIVAAAFTQSTSDFPILLENTMHKTLQAAYAAAPYTWNRWCRTGSVSDFRTHNRYRRSSLGNLLSKTELGEFKNVTIPDGEKSSITAATKGYLINLSRETIINDDLDAFVGLSADMGRAARRTVEADAYAALASNSGLGPNLADGNPLFHARSGGSNIGTGAALSVDAIDADRVLMAQQRDVGANDYLDLRPSVLVVPIGLGGRAREINAQEYNDEANKANRRPNTVRGLFADVVDTPRLSGTRRYLFADPQIAPAMEVAFLDGNDEPYLEMEMGFDVDGSRWKVRLDYGVAAIDFRGAVTNAGA